MPSALLVRFRPAGPWRLGPDSGAKDRTDRVFHSDSLYSALTIAMRDLGWLEAWISDTAASHEPAVRLSSCFPYSGRTLLLPPPRSVWPAEQKGKLRWKAARFVPSTLIPALLRDEELSDDHWAIDPVSECLLPVLKGNPVPPPFRVAVRTSASVDRVTNSSDLPWSAACLQFTQHAGMWFAVQFASEEGRMQWLDKIKAACRLLADTGVGGARSRGWGRSEEPRFESTNLVQLLTGSPAPDGSETAWWLLSLFTPAESDAVDWKRGNYAISVRSGRTAAGALKGAGRAVAEGSVLLSGMPLSGMARDTAIAGAPHPVYRSGIALAVPIPWKENRRLARSEPRPEEADRVIEEEPIPMTEDETPELPAQEPPAEEPTREDPPVEEPPVREPGPEEEADTTEGQPS